MAGLPARRLLAIAFVTLLCLGAFTGLAAAEEGDDICIDDCKDYPGPPGPGGGDHWPEPDDWTPAGGDHWPDPDRWFP